MAMGTSFCITAIFLGLSTICIQYSNADGELIVNEKIAFQETLGHLKPQTSPKIQAKAAKDVAKRLLGDHAELFSMFVNPNLGIPGKDTFELRKNAIGKIEIFGTSGVAVTWGLHYYLKHYCNAHLSWEGAQINISEPLPNVSIQVTSNDRFRYYQNVCTAGYSFVWWQWSQWEKHIDWMALNGINLALAFTGQEAIWARVYQEFNLQSQDVDEHFAGPPFLPWARMGNIRGWGGPLSKFWHRTTLLLQHNILRRMRVLGIIPVLPAFAGHVPRAFSELYPNATLTKIGVWNKFEDQYCCPYLLDPTDPLFQRIGQSFLRAYIKEFGTDHVYNCDTFNENKPTNSSLEHLRNIGQSIFTAMQSVDPMAIWIMQGWLFVHDIDFWSNARVETFIKSVPIGKMIILDLQSEQWPQYTRLQSYYGQPFIWCMLHNFGGTLGMFGSAEIINQQVFQARNMTGSTMIGTGLTPEGINQNYVIYELMNEMAYRKNPVDLDAWFENYATRRYGVYNGYTRFAWKMLGQTVYNFKGMQRIRGHYVITMRPSLKITPWTWYNRETFFFTWVLFMRAAEDHPNNELYKHDTVDLTRQALQIIADDIYIMIMNAYRTKDITSLQSSAGLLLDLFDDLERILASGRNFLLGNWLHDSRAVASFSTEADHYESIAKNQITLWGPNGEIIDYANKQWSGVVKDYFKPRWAMFLDALENSLIENKPFNMSQVKDNMFYEVERNFTYIKTKYPTDPQGDCIGISTEIFLKWIDKLLLPKQTFLV